MKKYFFFSSLIIIILIFFYIYKENLNINNFLKKIEDDTGLIISINENESLNIFPVFYYQNKISINHRNNDLESEEALIRIKKNYWPTSKIDIDLDSESILYKGLNFRNANIISNYKNKIFILKKFTADLIEGNISTSGQINFDNSKKIFLKGSFKNIYFNRALNQLNIANWKRVNIKISSPKFNFNTINGSNKEIIENLNGKLDIKGSLFFVSTEEEKFGATLLSLIADKFSEILSVSKSVNYLLNRFADIPSDISGNLKFTNGFISSENLLIQNEKGKAKFLFKFDILENSINGKILFFKEDNIFLEAELKGNLQNPEILISDDVLDPNNKKNIKNIFEDGIQSLVDRILKIDD